MYSITPFADFLKLTTPLGEFPFLRDALSGVIVESGASEVRPGLFQLGPRGKVLFGEWGQVGTVSVTGNALTVLRDRGLFLPFLGEVGACPHRVTRLDVALDVVRDGAQVVRRIYRQASAGGLKLTRKAIAPAHVTRLQRVGHADGRTTGTVYLGARTSDIHARVYDKRDELLSQAVKLHGSTPEVIALNDPGPLTRYELTFGRKVGMTLRDVVEPAALFWRYASNLLRHPGDVPEWVPHSQGFELPRHAPDPVRQLRLLLESSPDIKRATCLANKVWGIDQAEALRALRSYLVHGASMSLGHPVRA